MKSRLAALIALVLLATGCTAGGTNQTATSGVTLPSPTVGLSYIPNIQFSPFYLAETDGDFTKSGVAPVLRHHGSAEGLFTAIASGKEQFVVAGGDELMQAREEGMDLVAVAAYYRSYPVEVIVPADSTIQSLADLKGRKIGLPGKYGESWFGLQLALRSAGLGVDEVEIQEIGYTQQAALSTNKVDAIIGFANNDAVQFKMSGFAIRELPIAEGVVPLVSTCLITTTQFAAEHPEEVKAVASGMLAGIQRAVDDPTHALEVTRGYVQGLDQGSNEAVAEATLAATVKLWAPDGSISGDLDPTQWAQMAKFMEQAGLTAGYVDPTGAFVE